MDILLVLIFADFAVFDKVRENLYSKNVILKSYAIFLTILGIFAAFCWRIRENMYPRNTVISITAKISTRKINTNKVFRTGADPAQNLTGFKGVCKKF